MAAWLLAAFDRVPLRGRRVAVMVSGLVAVAAVMVALTVAPSRSGGGRAPRPTRRAHAEQTPTRVEQKRVASPVSTPQRLWAREAAERFLGSYLPFAYGRAGALAGPVTPGVRRQLRAARAQITPVERRRHPHAVSLQLVGTTPGFVVATAIVKDGGIAASRLRFTIQRTGGRRVVSGVVKG